MERAGGPRAAHRGPEGAGRAEAVEPRRQLGAQRQRRLLEIVLEPGCKLFGAGRGEPLQRFGIEVGAGATEPVELRVDRGGGETLAVRHQHGRERGQLQRLDALPHALDQRVVRVELAGHVRAEVGGEPDQLLGA